MMTLKRSRISAVTSYAPERVVRSEEIEKIINHSTKYLPGGIIESKFGIKERRFAAADEQASDLAVSAASGLLTGIDKTSIDCLIFASGSSDLIEPATANIVQHKLGLSCPVFDIKNACNSFVSGLQVADSFIISGTYKRVLVVVGEKLSIILKLDPENKADLAKRLAGLSMGDAGAAALVELSSDDSGMYVQQFETYGEHWHLCTVPGGGSMFPHDGSKVYFEGNTKELRDVFLRKKSSIVEKCLAKTNWKLSDIDHFFMHHVSESTFDLLANSLGVERKKFFSVIENYGNLAAASIPFAMSKALERGVLKKGDKVMLIGLASGISISIQILVW